MKLNLKDYSGKKQAVLALVCIGIIFFGTYYGLAPLVAAQGTRLTVTPDNIVLMDDLADLNASSIYSPDSGVGAYSFLISSFTNATGTFYQAMNGTSNKIVDSFTSSDCASVINPVLLPSFAKMKENKPILKESLLSVNNSIATIFIPITVFMAANSNEIISLFYGSQYKTGGLALSILSITVFVRVQTSVLSQAYFGLGLPHLIRQQSLKRTVLIAVLMYPAARFAGLSGAAAVMLLASVAMFIFQLYNLGGILYFRPIDYFSTWHMGVGFGVLVFIPSVFIFVSEIDSVIFKSVLSAGVMVIVIIIGCIKMFKTTVQ